MQLVGVYFNGQENGRGGNSSFTILVVYWPGPFLPSTVKNLTNFLTESEILIFRRFFTGLVVCNGFLMNYDMMDPFFNVT